MLGLQHVGFGRHQLHKPFQPSPPFPSYGGSVHSPLPPYREMHARPEENAVNSSSTRRPKIKPQLTRPELLERRDCPATISITGGTETLEGGQAVLQVVLSEPLAAPASVRISLVGSSVGRSDYLLAPRLNQNVLTFGPGETVKNLVIQTTADVLREPTERVVVSLTRPINCTVGAASTVVTILDDDSYSVTLAGPSSTVVEGDSAVIALTLSSPATKPEVFRLITRAESAIAGRDFEPVNTTVRIPRGGTTASIAIPILHDSLAEGPETFLVQALASVRGTPSPAPARITIAESSPPPTISVADITVTEGNSGTTAAVFTVSLSAASLTPVTVRYATANGTATSADTDYTPASGTLSFAPGETQKSVSVAVLGDTRSEQDEAFYLVLSSPTNASLVRAQATATIRNDDAAQPPPPTPPVTAPSWSVQGFSVVEGNAAVNMAQFIFVLTFPTNYRYSGPIGLTFSLQNGTAIGGQQPPSDYLLVQSAQVQFSSNGPLLQQALVPAIITIFGDTTPEPNETLFIVLSNPTNGSAILTPRATVTITNDDSPSGFGAVREGKPTLPMALVSPSTGLAAFSSLSAAALPATNALAALQPSGRSIPIASIRSGTLGGSTSRTSSSLVDASQPRLADQPRKSQVATAISRPTKATRPSATEAFTSLALHQSAHTS